MLTALICVDNVSACWEESELYAGKDEVIGFVAVTAPTSTGKHLAVKYVITDSDWTIAETNLAVAKVTDWENPLSGIPTTKKGGPKIGHFPYTGTWNLIPLADLGVTSGDTVVIAAHAVVQIIEGGVCVQEETAWANTGYQFPSGWGLYFFYTIP
jgi:hypothetical protein